MTPSPPPRTSNEEPLLEHSRSPSPSTADYQSISKSRSSDEEDASPVETLWLDRSVESDVLPETAVLGRNLGWSSAYILIISRVIGSGIFATPGAIVRSVGSVGMTLMLWVIGALVSWFGLVVSLEYGCMLPRSGGEYDQNCWAGARLKVMKVTRFTSNLRTGILGFSRRFLSPFSRSCSDSRRQIASSLVNTSCLP